MIVETMVTQWTVGLAADATATSYATRLPTTTMPVTGTTRVVLGAADRRAVQQKSTLCIAPYGTDTNNETVNVKVIGWKRPHVPTATLDQWVPFMLADVSATLSSTLVGVASQPVVATEFFADTLSLTNGIATLLQGTADVDIAYFQVEAGGWELVEIQPVRGTAVTANVLYWWE